jgi:hypothetical protein
LFDIVSTSSNPTPTIDQLLAIEACREAARRYSYGLDRLDVEVMKSAYWPDGTDDHGLFVGNAQTFCDMVVASHGKWTFTMHSIYNHRVDIGSDGVNAGGEAYCITHLFNDDERQMSTWYGRYQDAYEQRDGEWRIMHRVCVHHGTTVEHLPDSMAIDESKFRQASFDRPANQRLIGP